MLADVFVALVSQAQAAQPPVQNAAKQGTGCEASASAKELTTYALAKGFEVAMGAFAFAA